MNLNDLTVDEFLEFAAELEGELEKNAGDEGDFDLNALEPEELLEVAYMLQEDLEKTAMPNPMAAIKGHMAKRSILANRTASNLISKNYERFGKTKGRQRVADALGIARAYSPHAAAVGGTAAAAEGGRRYLKRKKK